MYILCVHIEGRVVGVGREGVVRKGVRIEVRIERISKEGRDRGSINRGSTNRGDK